MIKTIGYILLITCVFLWLLIPLVPFMEFTAGKKAGIITGLIIAGEVTFYLGIAFLGKTIYAKIKDKLKFWKKAPPSVIENVAEQNKEQNKDQS